MTTRQKIYEEKHFAPPSFSLQLEGQSHELLEKVPAG